MDETLKSNNKQRKEHFIYVGRNSRGEKFVGAMPYLHTPHGADIFEVLNLRQIDNDGYVVDEPELVD